ncbi:M23 family metallopeptidase [Marinobacterium litorale]|uniref:M23 family metallopeptidase n=1 Tax=Marinobacterium litorale TaxID=404770 RepID=UPI000417546C|nr:M23 family metallopeptidase [Marinobacterium litorale]
MTLTTVHGSRQYTLNQIAKYIVAAFLLMAALSFFVSNLLLVKTTDDLLELEDTHQQLSDQYELMLGTQQLYRSELNSLGDALSSLYAEREELAQQNQMMGTELENLESMLGVLDAEPAATAQERAEVAKAAAKQRLFMLYGVPNGVPIQSERINDRFGMRNHPTLKKRTMHNGIDFKAAKGTPVYATADGVVEFAGYNKGSGYGYMVRLTHNLGFKTYYAHLDSVKVKPKAFVHKGQLIGLSGNSGRSTGPHLHYEVRHLYTPLDPEPFMKWGLNNFESIFSAVEEVQWESLSAMYPLNQAAQP